MNEVTETGQTALHIAVHQGHARIVERLVGFGIDLNMQDSDGDTALHITLARDTADTLSAETPQLKKVCTALFNTVESLCKDTQIPPLIWKVYCIAVNFSIGPYSLLIDTRTCATKNKISMDRSYGMTAHMHIHTNQMLEECLPMRNFPCNNNMVYVHVPVHVVKGENLQCRYKRVLA